MALLRDQTAISLRDDLKVTAASQRQPGDFPARGHEVRDVSCVPFRARRVGGDSTDLVDQDQKMT